MIIPCITVVGTFPIFYLVTVTRELSECVMTAQYPSSKTIVLKHVPNVSDGMKPVGERYYSAMRLLRNSWISFRRS